MKSIIVLGITIILALYLAMVLLSNRLWPEDTLLKAVNAGFAALLIWLGYDLITVYLRKSRETSAGLVNRAYSTVARCYVRFSDYTQAFHKQLIIALFIAAGIIALSLLSLGLPGAVLMELPVKLGFTKPITGDNAWPAALFISIIWPLFIPFGVIIKYRLMKYGYSSLSIAVLPVVVIGAMIASVAAAHLLFSATRSA